MKPNLETIRFFTMRGMMQFCDKYAGVYSQYIFAIPLMRYLRVDPLPDIMDPAVRKKYRLKEIVEHPLGLQDSDISSTVSTSDLEESGQLQDSGTIPL